MQEHWYILSTWHQWTLNWVSLLQKVCHHPSVLRLYYISASSIYFPLILLEHGPGKILAHSLWKYGYQFIGQITIGTTCFTKNFLLSLAYFYFDHSPEGVKATLEKITVDNPLIKQEVAFKYFVYFLSLWLSWSKDTPDTQTKRTTVVYWRRNPISYLPYCWNLTPMKKN